MKRLPAILLFALPRTAATTRYEIKPVYSTVRFSIVKWGVLKEEGVFRNFNGTLDYDAERPERSRVDLVVDAASLDTKNDGRDSTVKSEDFLDVRRHPTMEFHSTAVKGNVVTGNLTLHGVTRRIQFQVKPLGIRNVPRVGKLAGFETTFTINRQQFGVTGGRWTAAGGPGVLSDAVEIHIIIGATEPRTR